MTRKQKKENMFRDLKIRIKIAWKIITNQYTKSDKKKCWWLWTNENITIKFTKE